MRMPGQPKKQAYRGPDRRGIIRRIEPGAGLPLSVAMVAALVALPIAAGGAVLAGGLPGGPIARGAADAAFVAFATAAVLLAVRWRLVGEAACLDLATAALLVGVYFVPVATRLEPRPPLYLVTLRDVAALGAAAVLVYALKSPEVRADLHPSRALIMALLPEPLLALVVDVSPARVAAEASIGGMRILDLLEAAAMLVVAAMALTKALRQSRTLFVAVGAVALSVGAAGASTAHLSSGAWSVVPALLLLVAAVELVIASAGDLQCAIRVAVRQDVRGRRRWEAAEIRLTEVRKSYQGERHDLKSMLSAIDGMLLALERQRDRLPPEEVDRLIDATRDDLHWAQAVVAGNHTAPRRYDLAELLGALASVRSIASQQVYCEVEPGLEIEGHPDRIAMIVNNLLSNAAIHAPLSPVTVTAKRVATDEAPAVEILVSDDGPGLTDDELKRAFQRGWRGSAARRRQGSGLGLAQCQELAGAEGARITLVATHPSAPPGRRGITARLRIPVGETPAPATADRERSAPAPSIRDLPRMAGEPESAILQMRLQDPGA